MSDLSEYKAWLIREGYQPSTVKSTLWMMKRLALTWALKDAPHTKAHIRRYLRFVEETGKNPLGLSFSRDLRKHGFSAVRESPKQGSRKKRLLTPAELSKIRRTLRAQEDAVSILLSLYVDSGLRIGPFLRQSTDNIPENHVAWFVAERRKTRASRYYELIAETERAAYLRFRKNIRAAFEGLDLDTLYKSRISI